MPKGVKAKGVKVWPLLTGTIRYEKKISTHGRGHGEFIDAPILAYLIATPNGRILYDVGCDYRKVSNPGLQAQYFYPMRPTVEPPKMGDEQRIPRYLARLGLCSSDIDVVFVGHLHFDHVGGLCELPDCEVHVHADELAAAHTGMDGSVFKDELADATRWHLTTGEYTVTTGIRAVASPGHTAGHMSLFIELQKGSPIILCGDAADLSENLSEEIAPGCCWQDNQALALTSIRKLKSLAAREKAELWPNHDMAFYRGLPQFPAWRD
ncbi:MULTISPECIES: N-acyl homoserine lactonase family protein [unclassified Nitrosospira]|uniref:N-acyl homoserine lactonase family protein n=1 Tax=unclassified Nitrosospira TaxID=2609267 RepID=UPI000D311E96|nr:MULTISPECIES: N-acyl homoserine lactonase family protein [unclassified Nitrosospira]PTR17609.1 N-acyl homoserine lactone hydrolase [Nitrosospira sp. Nsp2]WON74083.1 N-acyl homoserine lactonase family protein [Nitrosospira sp. Is2]